MNNFIKYGGWIALVLVLIVGGLAFNVRISAEKARARLAELELEKVKALLSNLVEEVAQRQAHEKDEVAPAPMLASPEPQVDPPVETAPPEPEPATPAAPEPAPAPNVELEDRVAKAQLNMMAEMTYKSLFDELELMPEVRASLKDAIAAHMLSMQQETGAAMDAKNETCKAFHARMEAMKGTMRDELAQFLSPEELTAWDEYEPVADQMLYERMVDGQMNMIAPGLTNENRVLASQVMAEELVRELDALGQSEEIYSMDSHNGAQARALNASLERLAAELDEDQYGQDQGFVNQAIAMFDAMKGR
jgi:hypothetical protein